MAKCFKCDRCGRHFDKRPEFIWPSTADFKLTQLIVYAENPIEGQHFSYDLCNPCAKDLWRFIQNEQVYPENMVACKKGE